MKNGDFLTLGDGGLLTVAKIAEQLGVSKELVGSETIKLPGVPRHVPRCGVKRG